MMLNIIPSFIFLLNVPGADLETLTKKKWGKIRMMTLKSFLAKKIKGHFSKKTNKYKVLTSAIIVV